MRAMHNAGNDRIRLAKVRLGMTRRVRQRHEHLPQTKVPFANVILHDRLLAREAMFVTKTLEDPLRRVPLLAVNRAILFQNAVDDIRERRQLRALRRLASPISRRFRMQQYLGNRLAVDPELARSFPSAQTLTMTRQSHSSIKIHSVHPPPSIRSILTKAIDGPILVRRRNRTNRPLHWGIIAPPFSEQVRTYDVSQEFSGDRGIMVARVFQGTVRLTRKPIPGASFLGDRARTVISQAEFVAIRRALERGGAFAADPATLFLRSDTFYWTVAACSGGRFHFRAFKGPPQHLERLPFAAILFRLDETGAPYNRPRRTDIDRLTNYGRISEPPSQSNFVTFELKATAGGLQ